MISSLLVTLLAFCPDPSVEEDYGYSMQDDSMLLFADDDPLWATKTVPALSTTTTDPMYWKPIIAAIFEKITQDWSRLARTKTKIGFRDWLPLNSAATGITDGEHGIEVYPCLPGDFAARAGASPGECGIVVKCIELNVVGSPLSNGSATTFARTMSHEMGHCLGIDHPEDCIAGNCLSTTQGAMMAQNGCGGVGKRTDLPHPDDVRSHHLAVDDNQPTFTLPRRTVVLETSAVSTVGGLVPTSAPITFAGSSAYPARIDCRLGGSVDVNSPDCVMARTYTEDEVRLTRLSFPGVAPTTVAYATTPFIVKSRRATDIAMSLQSNVAAAVVNVNGLSAIEEVLQGNQVMRIDTTNGNSLGTVDVIAAPAIEEMSTFEPRIAFVRGLGAQTCSAIQPPCPGIGLCSNGICFGSPSGRFLVGMVKPNRQFALFRSSDNLGAGVANPAKAGALEYLPVSLINSSGVATELDPIDGSFDIACPKHTGTLTAATLAEARNCRIWFTPATMDTLTARLKQCRLQINATGTQATVSDCSTTQSVDGVSVGTIIDYGTGQPVSQLQGRHWFLSVSKERQQTQTSNTRSYVFTNAAAALGVPFATLNRSMDASPCTINPNNNSFEWLRSYFGEVSEDYCDKCDRMVSLKWGDFVNEPTQWSNRCR
jgi:hypothetical protein